jgi:hypothetical protein
MQDNEEKAEALSPNTTLARLKQIAYSHPLEVLQNPVLPLLSLEDPLGWSELVSSTLEPLYWKGFRHITNDQLSTIADDLEALFHKALNRIEPKRAALLNTIAYVSGSCSLAEFLSTSILSGRRVRVGSRGIQITIGEPACSIECWLYSFSLGSVPCQPSDIWMIIQSWLIEKSSVARMQERFGYTPETCALLAEKGVAEVVSYAWENWTKRFIKDLYPLLTEAEKHPKLRALFIYGNDNHLYFSRTTCYPYATDALPYCNSVYRSPLYQVHLNNKKLGYIEATAAIELCLANMPEDVGPVILGDKYDL